MGNISSANFKKSKDFQVWHNADIRPSYAIGGGLEVNRNGAEALELKNQIIQQAIDTYNHTKKPKAPAFKAQSYEWSLVINLKESSTLEDCEQVAKMFAKDYGFQCYQIAIHRDEGHIDENGERHINHHAHLEFITLDKQTGKNRFRAGFITPKNFSAIQDKVAQILQMERGAEHYKAKQIAKSQGKKYNIPKRIEPRAYGTMKEREKAERKADLEKINDLKADNTILEQMAESMKQERDSLKAENATLKEKNAEFELTRQAWIAEQNKKKEDYRALSALKQDLAKKNLTIEQVREYIENLENELRKEREERKKAENDRARLAAELESKNTQNRDFADTKTTAPIQPKSAEITPSVAVAPKIEQPTYTTSALQAEIRANNATGQTLSFEHKNDYSISITAKMHENTAKKYIESLAKQGMKAEIYKNPKAERTDFSFGVIFAKTSESLALAIEYMKSKLGLTDKEPEIQTQKSKENKISNPSQTKEIKTLNNKPKINEKSKSKQNDSYGMSM